MKTEKNKGGRPRGPAKRSLEQLSSLRDQNLRNKKLEAQVMDLKLLQHHKEYVPISMAMQLWSNLSTIWRNKISGWHDISKERKESLLADLREFSREEYFAGTTLAGETKSTKKS